MGRKRIHPDRNYLKNKDKMCLTSLWNPCPICSEKFYKSFKVSKKLLKELEAKLKDPEYIKELKKRHEKDIAKNRNKFLR